jgi:hypothetical protein
MRCMLTRHGKCMRGTATSALRAVTAGWAVDTTGTEDRDSDGRRTDMPGAGKEIPTAPPKPIEATTTGPPNTPTTICRHEKADSSSTVVSTAPAGAGEPEKATAAGLAHPTAVRRLPIARRAQVFSTENSGNDLLELSRAGTSLAPPKSRRARVAFICLATGTSPRALAAGARAASAWEVAGMCRRVLMAAENISEEVTRAVEEVTPAVMAAAGIAAEASGPRVPSP